MAFPLVSRSFFVTLASISTYHDAFGHQTSMKIVAIISLSMYSLLRNGVTLKSCRVGVEYDAVPLYV